MPTLTNYLVEQPFMMVLKSLVECSAPRHLREIATQCALSPGGVSDIIRRLKSLGVVIQRKEKNKNLLVLRLSRSEREYLAKLFDTYRQHRLVERAATFRNIALKKFQWMDDASAELRQIKAARRAKK